jgi:energy-coupling factor transport system ATP-binding protein
VAVRTKAALAEVGLLEDADSHPYDLHASQRKLVAITATLAMQPKIVILDEPTPGQDVEGVNRVGTITDRLASQGRTVIVISHDIDFCAEHCNRVIVMARGQILADGPTESIFSQSELLAEAEIEPPQLTRLALSLGLPRNPLSVARFLAMFAEAQKGEHP